MSRIRTIKPEFFTHEDLFELEQETGLPVRLAYAGIWTQCDREGRFKWRPQRMKLAVLPYDDVDFSRVMDALATRGLLVKYEVDNVVYGHVPSFLEHQHINGREIESTLPDPRNSQIISNTSTRDPHVNYASATREARYTGGREGKGREGNICELRSRVDQVYEYWVTRMGKDPDRTKPTPDRLTKIRARLNAGYTVEQICESIDGYADSAYHNGDNPQGKKYLDIALICRNTEKLEAGFKENRGDPNIPNGSGGPAVVGPSPKRGAGW